MDKDEKIHLAYKRVKVHYNPRNNELSLVFCALVARIKPDYENQTAYQKEKYSINNASLSVPGKRERENTRVKEKQTKYLGREYIYDIVDLNTQIEKLVLECGKVVTFSKKEKAAWKLRAGSEIKVSFTVADKAKTGSEILFGVLNSSILREESLYKVKKENCVQYEAKVLIPEDGVYYPYMVSKTELPVVASDVKINIC